MFSAKTVLSPKTMFSPLTIFSPKTMFYPKSLFSTKTMFSPKTMFSQKKIHLFIMNHSFTKIHVFTKNYFYTKNQKLIDLTGWSSLVLVNKWKLKSFHWYYQLKNKLMFFLWKQISIYIVLLPQLGIKNYSKGLYNNSVYKSVYYSKRSTSDI